jgi:hypothetical protein
LAHFEKYEVLQPSIPGLRYHASMPAGNISWKFSRESRDFAIVVNRRATECQTGSRSVFTRDFEFDKVPQRHRQFKASMQLARWLGRSFRSQERGIAMRFFVVACLLCLSIASVGCMTHNWSSPLFQRNAEAAETNEKKESNFWNSKFGEASGLDPRSREIEQRLGL